MKLNKYIAGGLSAAMLCACASLSAQTKEEENAYIKAFGQVVAASNFADLNFNDEELALFIEGFTKGAKTGKAPENMQEIGMKLQTYLQQRAQKNIDEASKKNEAAADEFMKKLDADSKISKSESGLRYEIIEAGSDPKPTADSVVVVHYTGTLIDGTEFDSSRKSPEPAEFPVGRVIPGFGEGIQKVGKGGKVKLYIPAAIGYGNQPLPGIPAGSTLIFDVEVIDIKAPSAADMLPPAPQQN